MVIDTYDEGKNGAVISTNRFTELLRKDHDVSVITTGKSGPGKVILPGFYPPFFRTVTKRMQTPFAIPRNRIIKNALRQVHIVHVQFPFLLGVSAVRIARKLKIPVVSTFHIQAEHLAMNAGIKSERFVRYTYKFWLKFIYNRSDVVICPSRFAEDLLKQQGLKSKSVVLSNGFLPSFKPMKLDRKEIYNGRFIILSVGRFAPEKRHDLIIEAVNLSKHRNDLQLILIGEGPRKEKLQKDGEILPNQPVFLTLSSDELVYYYNIADLYLHAATVEVEGMTILEAMGCGLPLLLSDSPKSAAKQFALDHRSLFKSDDVQNLVNKIDYWIEHPDELRETGKSYLEKSGDYRIDNSYEKLVNLYLSLDENNHSRA
jgi:glycosyltransferase involved in cell wall biosynthesis